ncbi:NADH:flavin oxidoreductase / NADH oxidase family [Phytophthora infestans]|uniref:NADH:flavin oxidoreductase / NADH oxidase family n=1 Tax=Phytophthora infestans TaxID=4787 RepID=A0A833TGD6_PHYIN|nr:NADH:flavin oxidoreductase / NADH oxidase family [Phytophthora infestans]
MQSIVRFVCNNNNHNKRSCNIQVFLSKISANLADYELFKPLELAPGLTLKNRMVFSPCTRARSDIKTRCPNDENVKYYAARASAGLIISEGCAVSEQGYGWYGAPALYH